jgi:hypothetical protein
MVNISMANNYLRFWVEEVSEKFICNINRTMFAARTANRYMQRMSLVFFKSI